MDPASKERKPGKPRRWHQEKLHREEPAKKLAAPFQRVRLSRKNGRRTDWSQGQVFGRHRATQDLLPSARADNDDGSSGIARGSVAVPGVSAGNVGNSPQTIRAEVAPERAVMRQASPRV